jgi:hypothetical protein
MQKYTTKQLLEILEDDNFEYDFHDCLVGHPNRHLALQQLKDLNNYFNLVITTEDNAPLNKIINTFVRTYSDPVFTDLQEKSIPDFTYVGNNKATYKNYTVKDILVLIDEMKDKFSTECYSNIINFLDKITKDKDENFYMEYITQRLDYEDTKLHMINDFINKYLCRYYAWLFYDKNWENLIKDNRLPLVTEYPDPEEFKNEFEIYLLV